MTVKNLIEKLNEFNPDANVAVFDWKKNMHDCGDAEGSYEGCYGDFEVSIMDKDCIPEGSTPWVAISFSNPDLED